MPIDLTFLSLVASIMTYCLGISNVIYALIPVVIIFLYTWCTPANLIGTDVRIGWLSF